MFYQKQQNTFQRLAERFNPLRTLVTLTIFGACIVILSAPKRTGLYPARRRLAGVSYLELQNTVTKKNSKKVKDKRPEFGGSQSVIDTIVGQPYPMFGDIMTKLLELHDTPSDRRHFYELAQQRSTTKEMLEEYYTNFMDRVTTKEKLVLALANIQKKDVQGVVVEKFQSKIRDIREMCLSFQECGVDSFQILRTEMWGRIKTWNPPVSENQNDYDYQQPKLDTSRRRSRNSELRQESSAPELNDEELISIIQKEIKRDFNQDLMSLEGCFECGKDGYSRTGSDYLTACGKHLYIHRWKCKKKFINRIESNHDLGRKSFVQVYGTDWIGRLQKAVKKAKLHLRKC